jgi:hypothetical protein
LIPFAHLQAPEGQNHGFTSVSQGNVRLEVLEHVVPALGGPCVVFRGEGIVETSRTKDSVGEGDWKETRRAWPLVIDHSRDMCSFSPVLRSVVIDPPPLKHHPLRPHGSTPRTFSCYLTLTAG